MLSLSSVKIQKLPNQILTQPSLWVQIFFLYSNAAGDLQQIKKGICSRCLMVYADDVLQLWETGWCLVAVDVRTLKWHSNCGILITDPTPTVTNSSDSFASFGFVLIAAYCKPRYRSEREYTA